MRLFLVASVALVVSSAVAFADDDIMATRYGNTVIVNSVNRPEAHLYYNADHTFTGKVIGMDFQLRGTWRTDGADICMNYDPPPPGVTNPSCVPAEAHQIGDTWKSQGHTVTLVQGIQ
jgi:hypothetical protein